MMARGFCSSGVAYFDNCLAHPAKAYTLLLHPDVLTMHVIVQLYKQRVFRLTQAC